MGTAGGAGGGEEARADARRLSPVRQSRTGGPWSLVRQYPLVASTIACALVGLTLVAVGLSDAASDVITAYAILVVAIECAAMLATLHSGSWGLDVLAVAAILSTIAVGDVWAAVVVMLMISGGQALEKYASTRAAGELTALLERAPEVAHVIDPVDGTLRDVGATAVEVGDVLMIKPGELVPVDADLRSDEADMDESSLTGESVVVTRVAGNRLLSGSVNGDSAIEAVAVADAADSQYQTIVDLVASAAGQKAPFIRLADRFAVPFTIVAFAIAGVAWAVSGDPHRFAEVLVVATPCPLLIAAPVAFLAGMSRAAKGGVIVKSGGVLETLSRVRSVAFDKTGTLTFGVPAVERVEPVGEWRPDEILSYAAAAEGYSTHTVARAIAAAHVGIHSVTDVEETVAQGLSATVDHVRVAVGKAAYVGAKTEAFGDVRSGAGEMTVWVSLDGRPAGRIVLRDELRKDAGQTIEALHRLGVERVAILSGDAAGTAQEVAARVGIVDVQAGLLPADKVAAVTRMHPGPVMMVGDGVNDAPVLAAADVGVAMGARGATAASESADVVIMLDRLDRVVHAVATAQRTVRIATQSIVLGISLSLILMVIAAFGVIPAIVGAVLQEFVDLAAILNSLRATRGAPGGRDVRLHGFAMRD